MKNVAMMLRYLLPHKKKFLLGMLFCVLSVFFVLLLPQITQLFIDSVYSSSAQVPGVVWNWFIGIFQNVDIVTVILVLIISFILCSLLKNILSFHAQNNFCISATKANGDLRKACFKKLAFADKTNSQSFTFFNFTCDLRDFFDTLYIHTPKMIECVTKIIFTSILCFLVNWKIAIAFILFMPIMFSISSILDYKILRNFSEARNRKNDMLTHSEHILDNIKTIKVLGKEAWAENSYDNLNEAHSKAVIKGNDTIQKFNVWLSVLRILGVATALGFSVWGYVKGTISIGYVVLIVSYAFILFDATMTAINSNYNVRICMISIARLNKFLDEKTDIVEKRSLEVKKPDIKFFEVSVFLNGKTVFKNISFKVPFGNHTAILLNQGQGKSAIARLLLRFIKKDSGKIYIGDELYEAYNIQSLRKQFAYVPQEPVIFEGTIAENIAMFKDINRTKLQNVIAIAGLHNLVQSFPDKQNHFLVTGGTSLSAQDRQRISIARALYRNAPVLLLDSIFNTFPPQEAKTLIKKILREYRNKTILLLTSHKEETEGFDEVLTFQDISGGAK